MDMIAKMTAQTISKVQDVYYESNKAAQPPLEAEPDNAEKKHQAASFSYGTPFSNIMRFTKDVEVFTRHIDANIRKDFGREDAKSADAAKREKKDK